MSELQRMIFGSRSERFVPVTDGQIDLFTGTALSEQAKVQKQEISYTRTVGTKKKQKPIRTEIPSHLPRVEEVIEPSEIEPGSKKIGEEITEILEYNPANIYVRRIIRPKYAKPKNTGVVIAPMPSLPIPRSNAGAGMLAQIAVSKFIDHLPFYRQIQIFKRQRLNISPSTIGGWFNATCTLLEPLYDTLERHVLHNSEYLQADESPIGVQDSHKKGSLHQGYMWLFRNPENSLVLFVYNKGRSREAPEKVLENFTGTLQTDGYKVYQALNTKGDITLLGCMAHARRYFEKALDNDKSRSEHVLKQIQRLYAIERNAKEREINHNMLKRYRQIYALPVINEIEIRLKEMSFEVLPKSAIGKAIAYTLNIYPNLKRYIEDGKYEIDNNNIENAVRPLALGRKNYLFAGSHQSAQHAAMMYSFFASCKANNVNPFIWLNDILNRLPEYKANKIEELLPHNWM
ncbi:MAG: IS66 family transposase [Bacteroidales bacterium]|nr:IS66 family transposase [Bacteroidales bacterium]